MNAAELDQALQEVRRLVRSSEADAALSRLATVAAGPELTIEQRTRLQLQRAEIFGASRREEQALAIVEPLLASDTPTDDQRAWAYLVAVKAWAVLGHDAPPDALYALLDQPLSPLARCQALYALSYWHYVQRGDAHAGTELDERMVRHVHGVTDPEWRLRLLSWTLPTGGGHQWDPDAEARGREALGLARQLRWRAEERRILNQLYMLFVARDEVERALVWAQRAHDVAQTIGHVDGVANYHIDRVAVALATADLPTAHRHWQAFLAVQDQTRPTAVGRRLVELIGALYDRADGRWQEAYDRLRAILDAPDANNVEVVSTWLRVLADRAPAAEVAAAIADLLELAPLAHDPYATHVVHQAGQALSLRGDIDRALVRHVAVLTHRLGRTTGHRRLVREAAAQLADDRAGRAVIGPWSLVCQLGAGAMGEVWLADDVRDGRQVVVKLLTTSTTSRPRHIESLFTEARAMIGMRHRHLLQVLDYGHIDASDALTSSALSEGAPFLVLELAEAGNLGAHLGKRPWTWCRTVLLELLSGLAHAHAHEVVHLDIKPENVLLRSDGSTAIADFGIARAVGQHQDRVAGTPSFMAPEQWRGRWQSLGPWTDLYAVGMLAIELIQGRSAYLSRSIPELRRAHLERLPQLHPAIDVPSGLGDWILCMIAKAPEHRFLSAAHAAQALQSLGAAAPTAHADPAVGAADPTELETVRTMCVTDPWTTRDEAQDTWVDPTATTRRGVTSDTPSTAAPTARGWPELQLRSHLRDHELGVPEVRTHLHLAGLWPTLDAHDASAQAACWSALVEVARTGRPASVGLHCAHAEALDRFAHAFLHTCREAGLMRPVHLRRDDGSITGFLARLVGLDLDDDPTAAREGLMARGLDPALAERVVGVGGQLTDDDIRAVMERLARRSIVVLCVDPFPDRERIAAALQTVNARVLSLWLQPEWTSPGRTDLPVRPPSAASMAEAIRAVTGLDDRQVERLLEGVDDPGHAASRLVAHGVRGALVRRGNRTVLRELPLAASRTEERRRLLTWLYKRWDLPDRRVFEVAASQARVPTRWWWKTTGEPVRCIDLADALFRAGLVVQREQGWAFVEPALRVWAQELARSQGRRLPR